MAEVIVVGAGVVGTSVAFHLAERGVDALVVDRKGPAAGSTARSGTLVRAYYPTAPEADLAWESLTEYFEPWGERIGGGFTRTGFAYLAGEERAEALRYTVALGRSVGVETELAGRGSSRSWTPSPYERRRAGGLRAPRRLRRPYGHRGRFLDCRPGSGGKLREMAGGRAPDDVVGVQTEGGSLDAEVVVLTAGAWSIPLAASMGLELPIRPARAQVVLSERPYSLPTHLTLIDSVIGFHARPAAERAILVGSRAHLSWLEKADKWDPEPDPGFLEAAAEMVGRRIPTSRGAPYRLGRGAGHDPRRETDLGPRGCTWR